MDAVLSRLLRAALVGTLSAASLPWFAPTAFAAGSHWYVDGKNGNDANVGTTLSSAFRTLKHALDLTKSAGTTISIVGYADYVYYEQLDRPYQLPGTSTAPIIIEGYRPPSGPLVRPTISGAIVVNSTGSTRWSRPDPVNYPDVWRTSWSTPIRGYDAASISYRMDRVFFDTENQLTRPKVTPTLLDLQQHPSSEYWDGSHLYVHLGRWDGAAIDGNPNHHQIVIPNYNGIIINSFSSWVTIRNLDVIHAAPGIALHLGSHDIVLDHVVTNFNYPAGIVSQALRASFNYVSGRRNTMQAIKLDNGAVDNVVDHLSARQNPAQGLKVTGANTSGTIVRYSDFSEGEAVPTWVATYSGEVQGLDLEQGAHNTTVIGNTFSGMARGLMLYQVDPSGTALADTVVRSNYFVDNLHAVVLWDGRGGADGSGTATFDHNVYYHNGNAVFAPVTTTNKLFHHETVYWTYSASGTGRAALLIQGGGTRVVLRDSIIDKSPTYALMATDGATLTVSYSDVHGYSKAASYGTVVLGGGIQGVDPGFVSTTPNTSGFLELAPTSALAAASSTGGSIGAKTVETDVARRAGSDRYGTAAAISKAVFDADVPVVYIATGANYPDAIAGGPAAAAEGGPVLLVTRDTIPSATMAELQRLKPGRIVVLGGTSVISAGVASALAGYTSGPVARRAGSDRYGTAAAISKAVFDADVPVVYIATGANYPDAIAGGPAAAAEGGPVLLVTRDTIPSATMAELQRLKPGRIVVLGGTSVISAGVASALAGYTSGPVARRAGSDRYGTAAAISKAVFDADVPVVYIATGANYPDAIAGGPAAAAEGGPVLLVARDTIPSATMAELQRLKPGRIVVLGGTSVISAGVASALAGYTSGP